MVAKKRRYISQTDVPRTTLENALRVPRVLANEYGMDSARPFDVATALDMTPTSGTFRELCGASIGYGLTEGGPNASEVSLTQLGTQIVSPLEDGADRRGIRQAALTPTVVRRFLEKYDGSPLQSETIAHNVLGTMDVPADATQRVHDLILENARFAGFLKVIKDKTYVDLEGSDRVPATPAPAEWIENGDDATEGEQDDPPVAEVPAAPTLATIPASPARRVFVSHGKNRRVVDQLKELLTFGDFEPVVSVERESVSKPVPKKVMDDIGRALQG